LFFRIDTVAGVLTRCASAHKLKREPVFPRPAKNQAGMSVAWNRASAKGT
jgi:hypothetical protein